MQADFYGFCLTAWRPGIEGMLQSSVESNFLDNQPNLTGKPAQLATYSTRVSPGHLLYS